jgi:hypothetical protein
MFLIEFKKGQFIDAERINYIVINTRVTFTISGDNGNPFTVDEVVENQFLNLMQKLNKGCDIEARHHHINNPDFKY